ncbi:carbohydrate ABC transporter permease [Pseudoroseicyclus sp. H15]
MSAAAERGGGSGPLSRLASGPALWLLPTIALLGLFYLVPILDALRLAFTDASLLGGEVSYSTAAIEGILADPALGLVLRNTFVFAGFAVLGQLAVGLGIALLVVRGERERLWGMLTLRTIVLAAWVVPGVANGVIWQVLFSEAPYGTINSLIRLLGGAPVAWLSNANMAMVSVVVASVWQGSAVSMIILYAARKGIDPALYEAAEIDGAKGWEQFVFITLPQMRGALLVNAILVTIQMLNAFDAIAALTAGGPGRATEVLSLFTYSTVFLNYDLARGSALAILLLLISLVLALVYALFLPRGEEAQA